MFPEPRIAEPGSGVNGFTINHFFPWEMNPDGTSEETLNHIGRHELHDYFDRSFNTDGDLVEFIASGTGRTNPNPIQNFFHIVEDAAQDGRYYGTDAPEFGTHSGGQIVRTVAPPSLGADEIVIDYVTHPSTGTVVGDGDTPPPEHSGHYRDPLPLSNGSVLASHSFETRYADNEGSRPFPLPRHDFRLRFLEPSGEYLTAGDELLATAINRRVTYWDPDVLVTYDGPFWELWPTEIRSRPTPPIRTTPLEAPEVSAFGSAGVNVQDLQTYLEDNQLALIVSRDVTTRDDADRQQPFNLRIEGTGTSTTGTDGTLYDVRYLQLFQGDHVRGYGGADTPSDGRRVLARELHDPAVSNPPLIGAPNATVELAPDGSMAAFVPARRALSWQLVAGDGTPVVRERYWITFQPGEIRVCASCHGANALDQAGQSPAVNQPLALVQLLEYWRSSQSEIFVDGFESGDLGGWSSAVGG